MRLPKSLLFLAAFATAHAAAPDVSLFGKKVTEAEKAEVAKEAEAPKVAPKAKMQEADGEKPAPKEKMVENSEKPVAKPTMTEEMAAPKKPMPAEGTEKKGEPEMKKEGEEKTEPKEEAPEITPFRSAKSVTAETSRTFKLANLNKPLAFETTRELQRLFGVFVTQHITDEKVFVKAPGPVTAVSYTILQDLGEGRYVAKASWAAVGDALPAATDAWAILLLDTEVKVGATGNTVGAHAGTVALKFTAKFSPITDKTLTLRREAFVECKAIEPSNASLVKFIEQVSQGTEFSVITSEKTNCKPCNGLGYTREPQKGKLEDKRIPCTLCENGKLTATTETKFAP